MRPNEDRRTIEIRLHRWSSRCPFGQLSGSEQIIQLKCPKQMLLRDPVQSVAQWWEDWEALGSKSLLTKLSLSKWTCGYKATSPTLIAKYAAASLNSSVNKIFGPAIGSHCQQKKVKRTRIFSKMWNWFKMQLCLAPLGAVQHPYIAVNKHYQRT